MTTSPPIEEASLPALITDPAEAATAAGLRYVNDQRPGIRREPWRDGFRYFSAKDESIADDKTLARIQALAIPPAWTAVWICPQPNGHIQATGRDAKGRKQYRYHARWRAMRDETKYGRMIAFGQALPAIRERVEHDLGRRGLPREKVLAAVVRLLETTFIRVGNEEYARANSSFGLTTLRNRHVEISGAQVRFHFRGKSGKEHTIQISDRRLANIVKRCQELPGQVLFEYLDDDAQVQTIDSDDVNTYLRAISGQDFTAKDFRTWAGTVLAARALEGIGPGDSATQQKKNIAQAIKDVADVLGNTPAVCRKCYVHPAILECYEDGSLFDVWLEHSIEAVPEANHALRREEEAAMHLLRLRLLAEHAN